MESNIPCPTTPKVGKKWAKFLKKVLRGVNSNSKNAVKPHFSKKVSTY